MQQPVHVRYQHHYQYHRQSGLCAFPRHSGLAPHYAEHCEQHPRHSYRRLFHPHRQPACSHRYDVCRHCIHSVPYAPQHKQVAQQVPHVRMAERIGKVGEQSVSRTAHLTEFIWKHQYAQCRQQKFHLHAASYTLPDVGNPCHAICILRKYLSPSLDSRKIPGLAVSPKTDR